MIRPARKPPCQCICQYLDPYGAVETHEDGVNSDYVGVETRNKHQHHRNGYHGRRGHSSIQATGLFRNPSVCQPDGETDEEDIAGSSKKNPKSSQPAGSVDECHSESQKYPADDCINNVLGRSEMV